MVRQLEGHEDMQLVVAHTEHFLDWQISAEHPVNPIRSHVVLEELQGIHGKNFELLTNWANASELERSRWLAAAQSIDPELEIGLEAAELTIFGATYTLAEQLVADRVAGRGAAVYFNSAGGELSGQHEGVEVFNDLAYAAVRLAAAGLRVAYLDWDAHHSNRVEAALRSYPEILTVSIHQLSSAATTFSSPEHGFVNFQLGDGAGDHALISSVSSALLELGDLDALVMSIGADGLEEDPSSQLNYSPDGLAAAAILVGQFAANSGASILVGGGGGQLPLDSTPQVWANVVTLLASGLLMGGLA